MTVDLDHTFGNDLVVSATGDLATVDDVKKSQQRILRRLLTNPVGYIWHSDYGAGLARYIGQSLSSDRFAEIKSTIQSQIFLEQTVAQTPAPEIRLQTIQFGLYCQINYTFQQLNIPVVLTFNVDQ